MRWQKIVDMREIPFQADIKEKSLNPLNKRPTAVINGGKPAPRAKDAMITAAAAGNDVKIYDGYALTDNITLRYISVRTPVFSDTGAESESCKAGKEIYSALIILNEDDTDTETCFIYDIARDKTSADHIMKQLSKNGVTPSTAGDIIGELLYAMPGVN